MRIQKIVKLTTAALLSLLISACGGGDGTKAILDGYNGDRSLLDQFIDSVNGGTGAIANCSELDPQKVYLMGSLINGDFYNVALIDPEDPSKLCVGFDDVDDTTFAISSEGELIYGGNGDSEGDGFGRSGIGVMVPDRLTFNDVQNQWEYPAAPMLNDTTLARDALVSKILLKNNEDIFYISNGDLYSIEQRSIPYYAEIPGALIVTPGGSVIAGAGSSLVIIDPSLNRETLTSPVSASRFFSARMAGNNIVWVHVRDTNGNDRRWTVDIGTREITDDGLFSQLPASTEPAEGFFNTDDGTAQMNGSGNLVQLIAHTSKSDPYKYMVVLRTLASATPPATTTLINDGDYLGDFVWIKEPYPFVHARFGTLITGF